MPAIKISVIIPFYNEEKYISECLESVMSQTLKEIEIICVNDGSTDSSVKIVTEYLKKDKRIVLLNVGKKGGGAARNLALEKARGQFVAFLDSDDYYLDKNSLNMLYETAIINKVFVCGGLRQGLGKEKEITKHDLYRNICNINTGTVKLLYIDYQHDFHYHNYIYSIKIIKKYKIKFLEKCKFQDPIFFIKAMYYAKEYCIVPIEFYCYRGITQAKKYWEKEKILAVIEGLKDNLLFSREHELDILHWITAMRINNEYSKHILKYINNKNDQLFIALNEANEILSYNLISRIQKRHIPYNKLYGILSPIDSQLIEFNKKRNKYILKPLKDYLEKEKRNLHILLLICSNFKTIYRKIIGEILLLKEYGFIRTIETMKLQVYQLIKNEEL